jgi:hypothetical protein
MAFRGCGGLHGLTDHKLPNLLEGGGTAEEDSVKKLARFIEVAGITEDEALSALIAAVAPPQLGPMRQNWMRQPQFGHSAPDTVTLNSLFETADYRCTDCGSQVRLGIDHRNSDGADHSHENLQVLCFSCNRAKGRGEDQNRHHGRRLVLAAIELFDERGSFPTSKEIAARSGLTRIGRPELIAYLKRRLAQVSAKQSDPAGKASPRG